MYEELLPSGVFDRVRLQNLQSGEWIFAAGVQQENSDYDCTFGMAVPNTYNFLCWWWAYYITSGFGKRGRIEERFLVECSSTFTVTKGVWSTLSDHQIHTNGI